MSKLQQAVVANLTFTVGQLEELKSNINDTLRYIKQNSNEWDTKEKEDSVNESSEEDEETPE
jgi:hypothetical protein